MKQPTKKTRRRQLAGEQPRPPAPFRRLPGESWSDSRNRGARELGYRDYYEYRLAAGRRKGKSIQQARGHGGVGDRREKPAQKFRPGKKAARIFAPRLREAKTTATPAYFYDLLPYPPKLRAELVDRIVNAARRVEKKHNRVAYRFFRHGTQYEENSEPQFYYDDTVILPGRRSRDRRAGWDRFRADLLMGIDGVLRDPIVGVWLYGRSDLG